MLSPANATHGPTCPYREWKDTCETLHLWMHSWHVPLYVIARGLTTSPIYYEDRVLEIVSDFNRHALEILISVLRSRRQGIETGTGLLSSAREERPAFHRCKLE